MPNPWDAGSARLLEHLGFAALATTSSGSAATLGRLDGGVSRDEALEMADRAEAECIRRFLRMSELGSAISEAARRAEATLRLENALRYEAWRPAPAQPQR